MPRLQDLFLEKVSKVAKHPRPNRDFEQLLPDDLTGQVFIRAREEAELIRARLTEIEIELTRTVAEIKRIRRAAWAASDPVMIAAKRSGDILTQFSIEPARPSLTWRQKNEAAVDLSKEIAALETDRRRLLAEQQGRRGQLADLRKIASLAATSQPALITWLAGRWGGVLAIGGGVLGRLPKPAKMGQVICETDAAGNELPAEAQ